MEPAISSVSELVVFGKVVPTFVLIESNQLSILLLTE